MYREGDRRREHMVPVLTPVTGRLIDVVYCV